MNLELILGLGGTILTSIIGPIAVSTFTKWQEEKLKKEKEIDPLKEAIDINTLVIGKLEQIRQNVDADRVFLCQFHNGGHFYPTGQSIQKFSMVYEILSSSVSSQQQQFQNIPIALFNKCINVLATGELVKIVDFKTDEDFGLASFAENNGTQSEYLAPIMTIDDRFVGIVGIDFTKKPKALDDHQLLEFVQQVTSIGGTLVNDYLSKRKK